MVDGIIPGRSVGADIWYMVSWCEIYNNLY